MGVFDSSPATFYWVWSPIGPSYDGLEYGRWWIGGMLPFPVDGPTAEDLMGHGFHSTKHDQDKVLARWEGNNLSWRPVFESKTPKKQKRRKVSRKSGLDALVEM